MNENRVKKVKKLMDSEGIKSFLVTNIKNTFYLSGFSGSSAVLLITEGCKYLITDSRYIEQAKQECKNYSIIMYQGSILKTILDLLLKDNISTLGFEAGSLLFSEYEKMTSEISDIKLLPTYNLVEKVRVKKDIKELELIKKAVEITDDAFSFLLANIQEGMTEREVALNLEFFMKKNGASGLSFDTIVASGKRSALPHGVASDKKIERGDAVTIDFGCVYRGYCSDMTRTIFIGKPSHKQLEIYNIVLKSQKMAIDSLRAGSKASEIDFISREYIRSQGYGDFFGHGLGHSVGLDIHESPSLSPNDHSVLQENTTMTVEPGIYVPGLFGVRIEDLVIISSDGVINLTKSTKNLTYI